MTHYRDELLSPRRDPVDAPDQDFNWEQLYERLNEDATSGSNDPRLSETVIRILQMLLPPSDRRIQPQSLGMRLIALAWVLNPGYFDGSPSIRKLARRCGVRIAALANHTGYYSRLLRWRNRGQRHAWNWLPKGTPVHRGPKVKRNVPAPVKRDENTSTNGKKTGASTGEKRPGQKGGGPGRGLGRKPARAGRDGRQTGSKTAITTTPKAG